MDATILAYIAGFLDGDGSIFFQIVRRKDYLLGFQIRGSIAFYQKTDHQEILHWLQSILRDGYIRHRRTGISDYTIVGPKAVCNVLEALRPHVRLKKPHVDLGLQIIDAVSRGASTQAFLDACKLVDRFGELNYSKKRTNTAHVVERFLNQQAGHAPVETDPNGESPTLRSHSWWG